MESLHRIVYVSDAAFELQESEQVIADVLRASRRNNPAHGITGALLFSRGRFAQVLEGPLDALEELFETIQCDRRHARVTVLRYEAIDAREYPEWAMAYVGGEALRSPLPEGIREGIDAIESGRLGAEVVELLRRLVAEA